MLDAGANIARFRQATAQRGAPGVTQCVLLQALRLPGSRGMLPRTEETLEGGMSNLKALRDDRRADPRMVKALATFGMDQPSAPIPFDAAKATADELYAYSKAADEGFEGLFDALYQNLKPVPGVKSETVTIPGPSGNQIKLHISRPANPSGNLSAVVHYHGGGMVLLKTDGACYVRWREELAAAGMVVIGVDFRNTVHASGPQYFPAGTDDCFAGLRWVDEHRKDLKISNLIVSGESGGGNLTLSTALRANASENTKKIISGVYAMCPYISGAYGDPPANLASLVDNNGFFLEATSMHALARTYDPSGKHAKNPLAWPLYAKPSDMAGLPPHRISVNELDPLRDEGLEYYRMLNAAGIVTSGRVVLGTCHAGDMIFRQAMPDVYRQTIQDIRSFAEFCGQ